MTLDFDTAVARIRACIDLYDKTNCVETYSSLDLLLGEIARLRSVLAYIQECDGGPSLLKEAGALESDRRDDVRLENADLKAENDALRSALHEAVLQVIRDAMPRKEGEE